MTEYLKKPDAPDWDYHIATPYLLARGDMEVFRRPPLPAPAPQPAPEEAEEAPVVQVKTPAPKATPVKRAVTKKPAPRGRRAAK